MEGWSDSQPDKTCPPLACAMMSFDCDSVCECVCTLGFGLTYLKDCRAEKKYATFSTFKNEKYKNFFMSR